MVRFQLVLLSWLALSLVLGCNSQNQRAKVKDKEIQTHVVEIKQMKFVPDQITVQPGDSIKWVNRDIVSHNVAEEKSGKWISKNLETGDTYSIKVDKSVAYLCTLHPVMKGNISMDNE